MSDTYNLLERVLLEIEANIKTKTTATTLAKTVSLSPAHLQRLFRLAFGQPIAGYIRARKLAASLEDLLKTNLRITDIADEYGFEYERSYIRAFKREYGLTPGELRSTGRIIKIAPPLQLVERNKMGDGLFFGPELVMVPTFHVVGRLHKLTFEEADEMAPKVARDFWDNDRKKILNRLDDDVYIGLTRLPTPITNFSYYLPSVPVTMPEALLSELKADTFPTSLCAKFHYIGKHHYFDLNINIADDMYEAIDNYEDSKDAIYDISGSRVYFERIDKKDYDGVFCKMEWFAPVTKRSKDD